MKGGGERRGTRNQREGLKLSIHFAKNARYSGFGMVNTTYMTLHTTCLAYCFV